MGKSKRSSSGPSPPQAKRANKKSSHEPSSSHDDPKKTVKLTVREKIGVLKERELCNTRFAHADSMKEIGVLEGVKTLFANIGWLKLLEWFDVGYERTTLDFLSSVQLKDEALHFRLFKKECVLSMDKICQMIDAPTKDTFGPSDSTHADFHPETFWESITIDSTYISSKLKASQIVHPVLRVAHRLLSCIIDSRLDTGTVTLPELYLLWCMINPQSSQPNFGKFLCHKLLKVSKATKGSIFCGSVITILGRHESLHLQFPNGLKELKGPQYLDTHQMAKMKLFDILKFYPGHIWLRGIHKHIWITEFDREKLLLASPVANTKWIIKSNLPVELRGVLVSDTDTDTDSSADYQPEHITRFTAIDTKLNNLQADLDHIREELTDQRAMLRLMYAHQREMSRTIASIRDHKGHPGPQGSSGTSTALVDASISISKPRGRC